MNISHLRQQLKYCFGIATLIFISALCYGQEQKTVRDLGLWAEIKIEKEIFKDFQFSVSQHLRLHKNISAFDDYIAEAALEYKINKNFDIGTAGRYTRNNHFDKLAENDYRYDFYLSYDTDLTQKLKLFGRLKYQKEFYKSGVFNEFLNYFETTFRYRLKIEYATNENHTFYASSEMFRLTKKSREPFWDKYRMWIGDELTPSFGDIDLSCGIEHELNALHPYTYFILKMVYTIEL
jgi:hypothetical protein